MFFLSFHAPKLLIMPQNNTFIINYSLKKPSCIVIFNSETMTMRVFCDIFHIFFVSLRCEARSVIALHDFCIA